MNPCMSLVNKIRILISHKCLGGYVSFNFVLLYFFYSNKESSSCCCCTLCVIFGFCNVKFEIPPSFKLLFY